MKKGRAKEKELPLEKTRKNTIRKGKDGKNFMFGNENANS